MAGDFGFSPEDSRVEGLLGTRRVYNDRDGNSGSKKKEQEGRRHEKRHPAAYMHTISRAVRESNEQLTRKGLPYRFCIHESKGEIEIDIVMLDRYGNVVKEVKRNITNDDFDRLIENISLIEGLFIDSTG
ncbi:MAG: hypothetical protein JXA71_11195 [Chitinispirillaceae bacterium]|nr:hypothetical protein [Chitinispirillaceae bacterium]